MTVIIAHRGASRAAPENTTEAYVLAGAMGADMVELDVRITSDRAAVVHHDPVLPDGRPLVELASRELPSHIPSLDEAIAACAGMSVNVEIKNSADECDFDVERSQIGVVIDRLATTPQRFLLSSFDPGTIARAKIECPVMPTAQLSDECGETLIRSVASAGHQAVHPRVDTVARPMVAVAHSLGLAVNVWTCDDPERMAELISWGVDGICTNVPDVGVRVRSRWGDRAR